jgi:hypothetical protein
LWFDPEMSSVLAAKRLWVFAAVVGSYLIALTPFLLFGWEGRWLAALFLAGSSPFLAIAGIAAFLFAERVIANPLEWAATASFVGLVIYVVLSMVATGLPWALVGAPVAIIAPLLFWLMVRPLRKCSVVHRDRRQ